MFGLDVIFSPLKPIPPPVDLRAVGGVGDAVMLHGSGLHSGRSTGLRAGERVCGRATQVQGNRAARQERSGLEAGAVWASIRGWEVGEVSRPRRSR